MEYRFSIIIPVYNAESTLRRCLDSLLLQDCRDAEVIIINDGSSDKSDEICRWYQRNYTNVRYVYQANSGVSQARNVGLALACGEYITFVDSDDYVVEDYFDILRRSEEEFTVYGYDVTDLNRSYHVRLPECLFQVKTHFDFTIEILRNRIAGPCNKRFKRSIIEKNDIRFCNELVIGEDFIFGLEYMLNCTNSGAYDISIYHVDETGMQSITRGAKYSSDQFLKIYQFAFALVGQCKYDENAKLELRRILDYLYCRTVFACTERFLTTEQTDKVKPLIGAFAEKIQKSIKPAGFVHWFMRLCLQVKHELPFRIVAQLHQIIRHL